MSPRTGPAALAMLLGAVAAISSIPAGLPLAVAAAPAAARRAAPPILAWTDCGDGFECATATLPLDHDKPGGTTITVPLVRKRATAPGERIGSLFLNPGGPGGSGVGFLRAVAGLLVELNTRFDLVSFDPRGIAPTRTSWTATS